MQLDLVRAPARWNAKAWTSTRTCFSQWSGSVKDRDGQLGLVGSEVGTWSLEGRQQCFIQKQRRRQIISLTGTEQEHLMWTLPLCMTGSSLLTGCLHSLRHKLAWWAMRNHKADSIGSNLDGFKHRKDCGPTGKPSKTNGQQNTKLSCWVFVFFFKGSLDKVNLSRDLASCEPPAAQETSKSWRPLRRNLTAFRSWWRSILPIR